MNRLKFPMLAGALSTFALVVSPAFAQQPPQSATPSTQQDAASASSMNQAAESQTFTGQIAKSDGKYVLKDSASQITYKLDDQDRAKEFEGKTVRVVGKLEAQSKMIRVSTIEPAS
ncbi:MAG TPA: DUF5818 domain-containing protein [Candidatus Bathyarchaeia archaeon]|nr:DUF5818 domain-containing protein [Candidatus Bathyarchaeia archaeon]